MWHLIAHCPFPTPTPDRGSSKRARSCTVSGGISPKRLINPTYLADGRVGRPKLLFAAFCIICNSLFSLLIITMGEKEFSLLPNHPYPLWCPITLLLNGYWRSLRGIKRPWHEADHLTPPRAEVKNEWSYTSIAFMCLQGVGRDNFVKIWVPTAVWC
jgi:hypothetical protein